jgi:hypothetical protein
MRFSGQSSRRAVLLTLWRAFVLLRFSPREARAEEIGVRRLLESYPTMSVKRYVRPYQTTATILVFGLPIFKRKDVGSGCASVEIGSAGDQTVTALQFAAGSKPERARGLNRLGLMREAVVERGSRLLKTSYAGFMTSSPERSLDQGRQALNTTATEMPCTLGSGESGHGGTELSVRLFTIPCATRWIDAVAILNSIEKGSIKGPARHATSVHGPSATFLYAIHRAALEDAPSARRQFFHNAKLHELITEKHHAADSPAATRMTGSIRDQSGAEIAQFTVWFDPADPSGIPNRIEFRARSFLRLTFESEPGFARDQPTLDWLIATKRAENLPVLPDSGNSSGLRRKSHRL